MITKNTILQQGFENWLNTLGYAESTIHSSTIYTKDFLKWLSLNKINTPEQVSNRTILNYYKHLQCRSNKRNTGGLSDSYIRSNITALKRFSSYLQQTDKPYFEVNLETKTPQTKEKIILSKAEIKAMYMCCSNDYLGLRDKAMLGIYYGCGLRRSEGVALDLKDILLKEKRIHVRKGKNYRERYVPMTGKIAKDLKDYICMSRKYLETKKSEALLLSERSKRISPQCLIVRLNRLQEISGMQRRTGFHILRHSIATHLLQSGATLEQVSQFLGHASLESTQIYTHLSADMPTAVKKEDLVNE